MGELQSIFEKLSDEELINILTTEKNDYPDEAIDLAKEELKKRKVNLPAEDTFKIDSPQETLEWYYALNGERIGAISKSKLLNLYRNEEIFLSTKVWKFGMQDWIELGQTNLVEKGSTPPPLNGDDINNTLVWVLAFAPIIGTGLKYLISGVIGVASGSLWFVTAILNSVLCIVDEQKLKKAGYNTKELLLWAIFIVPVYLFRRAYLLKHKKNYAIVWCITFSVLIFAPSIVSDITGIADPNAVSSVKNGMLNSYPNKTMEQMVDNFVENPKWEAVVDSNGETYVNITGKITSDDKKVDMVIQYKVNDDGSFNLQALEFDGIPQNMLTYNALVKAMYTN